MASRTSIAFSSDAVPSPGALSAALSPPIPMVWKNRAGTPGGPVPEMGCVGHVPTMHNHKGSVTPDRIEKVELSLAYLPLKTPISDAKVLTGRQKPLTEVAFVFCEVTTKD